ncbi:MAG: acetyltransferase [Anaerosolibacter sp.]|uniref:GNAT family N-acetyltransferase n=1 Tax=Anaerosolibacter sp. TaxID=1872527 RepID=UPI00262BC365|nr:GNAT family N-acetyltransferase [Anaerosolibacter sp.]MDF2547491.1 acetyltransferase [Anaerosolibacter sp.]
MQKLLDYLRKNEYENVYIIRGLIHGIKDFHYEIIRNEYNCIDGIVAIWEDEKGAALRGNTLECSKWFDRLYGEYSLYELEESFVQEKLKASDGKASKVSIAYNLIMVYKPQRRLLEAGYIDYIAIDKVEWYKIAKKFKEKYNKEFIEFEPDNMEWLCVYREEEVIATICIEKVDRDLAMLSSFYVVPELRQQSIGTSLLRAVLRDYGDRRLMLFVDQDNTKARGLYERLGFKVYKRVVNIEI